MVRLYSYLQLVFLCSIVYGECPKIYQMIDKQHSYCAEKLSIRSLPPTNNEIELLLEMHNKERFDVDAKYMQKMVI